MLLEHFHWDSCLRDLILETESPISTMDMFSSLKGQAPHFETRKALVVINMQNDSFRQQEGSLSTVPLDYSKRIRNMIPSFRTVGDIFWIRTERKIDETSGFISEEDITLEKAADLSLNEPIKNGYASSQNRNSHPPRRSATGDAIAAIKAASANARADDGKEKRKAFSQDGAKIVVDDQFEKPRKRQIRQSPPRYRAGTKGAALAPEFLSCIDEARDVMIVKNHYSALEDTQLLLSLRMKRVTHLYLCGCCSNLSIYATATDAVRHGFEVTVVEDCLGYRSENMHVDAMRTMADLLGVSGIDSEEIIEDARGLQLPEVNKSLFPGMDSERPNNLATSSNGHESNTKQPKLVSQSELKWKSPKHPILGPGDKIGEGDSDILPGLLHPDLAKNVFQLVKDEVRWQVMHHRTGEVPRRVAVQGIIDEDGCMPLYRHPADETPPLLRFTKTVDMIRKETEKRLKEKINHALIQLYRDGQDNISEHSDKVRD